MSVFRPLCNILKIKMIPFGMQKTAFYAPKGGILEAERRSFRTQYAAFRNLEDGI